MLVQDHDFPHGANLIMAMHDALKRCRHFVALLSKDYDSTPFTTAEWTNFYAIAAQSGGDRRFIVLRVEDCHPQGLFSAVLFGDLVGVDDPHERRARILAAAEGRVGVVERRPRLFENVPPPDLNFVGRDQLGDRVARAIDAASNAPPPSGWRPSMASGASARRRWPPSTSIAMRRRSAGCGGRRRRNEPF